LTSRDARRLIVAARRVQPAALQYHAHHSKRVVPERIAVCPFVGLRGWTRVHGVALTDAGLAVPRTVILTPVP